MNSIKDDNQPGQQLSTNRQTGHMAVSRTKDDNKKKTNTTTTNNIDNNKIQKQKERQQ
jgi:hypothetical protein